MNTFDTSLDKLQREAAKLLKDGRKDEARDVLRQALELDRNNLKTWELLWQAANNLDEEVISLKRILRIDPHNAAAKKRLAAIKPTNLKQTDSQPLTRNTSPRPSSRRKRQNAGGIVLLFIGGLIAVLCVSVAGLALYRSGYMFPSGLTATALAERNAACQALINRTIQASNNSCDNSGSNTACYGNNTLKAELIPNAAQRFSERGDVIPVSKLQHMSAAPLNLDKNEWGIAVFKVLANLPRSLPGETVTMVVFGNAQLDNQSPNSDTLESFYFTSELGQIVCEKIPFDGLMINTPNGDGIHFKINGAELTLMGSASIKAIKNQNMEFNIYKGSARVVANGQEQYVGAGQTSSVTLGGPNGNQATSGPSAPQPITGDDLTMACTMTGTYCSSNEVTPISPSQAAAEIAGAITSTPTLIPTSTITRTPSPTEPPTYTAFIWPSVTPSRTITPTPKPSKTPTKSPKPTRTPTSQVAITKTLIPTATSVAPSEPLCTNASLGVVTSPNPNELSMNITNSSSSVITINRFFAYWVKSTNSQKIATLSLNGAVVWNTSDPDSPSDIPTEGNWVNGANLSIPPAKTQTFLIQFSNALQPTYEVHIVFDIGCQLITKKP